MTIDYTNILEVEVNRCEEIIIELSKLQALLDKGCPVCKAFRETTGITTGCHDSIPTARCPASYRCHLFLDAEFTFQDALRTFKHTVANLSDRTNNTLLRERDRLESKCTDYEE